MIARILAGLREWGPALLRLLAAWRPRPEQQK